MTPAEELRAAATKLRDTAAPLIPADGDMSEWTGFYLNDAPLTPHDAAWALLVHPGVAEPLAHMLDGYALRYDDEVIEDAPEGPCCAEPSTCGGHEEVDYHQECGGIYGADGDEGCPCFFNALAVARAINGGTS